MFKLLALRVLDDCAQHIQKCLKQNVYYYFCTDYRFEVPGKIYRGSKYTHPLSEDFFSIPLSDNLESLKTSPIININAIVGKNGDGKSTIVELVVRLANNYIAQRQRNKDFKSNQKLLHISGVCAELYFLLGNTIYKLYEDKTGKTALCEIANVEMLFRIPDKQFIDLPKMGSDNPEVFKSIYSFVSNYSHYAYNVYDFRDEWNQYKPDMTEDEENEACWLFHVFHKSDGYLTPLALHPYRKSGTIDIQREKSLTHQRLMALFINADDNEFSFRNIFYKKAFALKFTDPGYSKLYKVTLTQYLESIWMEDTSLDWAIKEVEKLRSATFNQETYSGLLKELQLNALDYVEESLDILTGYNDDFNDFLSKITQHLREKAPQCFPHQKHGKYKSQYSNIAKYMRTLSRFQLFLKRINIKHEYSEPYLRLNQIRKKYSSFILYNTSQLARILLIYKVAKHYQISPYVIFEDYDSMTEYQKCEHYIIYKVISILHKYPDYTNIISKHQEKDIPFEVTDEELKKIFNKIEIDIENDSHVTRKLAQALNYRINKENITSDYYRSRLPHVDLDTGQNANQTIKHSFIIALNTLKNGKKRLKLNELPPPIYNYEIMFRLDGHVLTGMNVLSSGEKQLLNNIGAIIYHLQNIDSVTSRVYNSVNLILEEIELYFHPEYQRLFIQRLIQQIHGASLSTIKYVNIMFVTHSPFVLSDIPKGNVLFLKDGKPDYTMQENTFGANIHSMLKNGFFLPNLPMGEFAYQKINELFRQLNSDDYDHSEDNIKRIRQEIAIIGEPYLREQLYRLLPNK